MNLTVDGAVMCSLIQTHFYGISMEEQIIVIGSSKSGPHFLLWDL